MAKRLQSSTYNKIADIYDALFFALGKNYEIEAKSLHQIINENKISPGKNLLDLGCGTGEHLRYLSNYYTVYGLDQSKKMLSIAKTKIPNANFIKGEMSEFYIDQKFDIIIAMFSAIAYVKTLKRLQATISNINRHLSPGGIVIIEPWYTPLEFSNNHNIAQFGMQGDTKACRMRESSIEGNTAYVTDHIMVSTSIGIKYHITNHKFGLFEIEDYLHAFAENNITARFWPKRVTERGVYIGHKNLED